MKGPVRQWSKRCHFCFFFCEPREQSCFICIRVTTEEGPRICVNLLSKCFGFCFHFLLRGKRSCAFSCNWFQIVQITCNTQLSSRLLLLLFPHPQSPSENKKRKWIGSPVERNLWKTLSLGKEPVCVQIRSWGRAWPATLGSKLHQ